MNVPQMEPTRLLGLTGSLRRDSFSTAILRAVQSELTKCATLEVRHLQLPLYNQDEEGEATPEVVRSFRKSIADAAGLVISTPEYNHGIPGVLKNALDQASRPSAHSVLKGKPTLVISNSPAFTGGVRAHAQINETLLSVDARIVSGRQVVIGGVVGKVKEGRFIDAAGVSFATAAIDRLLELCRDVLAEQIPS